MTSVGSRHRQAVLFDWGDTVMRVFPEYSGSMELWPRLEAIPGVVEAITEIRQDAIVCLATNAADSDEQAIRNALDRAGLNELFDRVFCFDVVGFRKPSLDFFRTVLEDLALDSDRVFMIGDDFESDVLGATAAGLRAVWLNRSTTEGRAGALFETVFSLNELVETLESLGFQRS